MVCPNCKQETSPALFCHACDAYLPNPAMGVKASVSRRFGALLLDSIAIWFVFFVVFLLSASVAGIGISVGSNEAGIGAFILTFLGAAVAYPIFALWFLSKGKTPGKWLVGIRAADKSNGSLPGLGRMLVRETIGKFLSGLFFGLGYFWAIFDKDAQGWHDKVAGTVVLRQPVATPVVAPAIVTTPVEPPIVAHMTQPADAVKELPTASSSPEPKNQVIPSYRHNLGWWVLGGFTLFVVILLGGTALIRQGVLSNPTQHARSAQTVAPTQQIASSRALAKQPERPAQIVREFPNYCPGEGGCTFGMWTSKSDMPVYKNRSTSSRIVFRLRKGDHVEGLSAVLDINRMGKAVVTQNTSKSQTGVALRVGQAVEIYYYEGEGCAMIEVDGAPKDFCAWESLREVTAPAITLWLQVKNSAGTNGWSNKREMFVGTSQYDQPDQNSLPNFSGIWEEVDPQTAANPMLLKILQNGTRAGLSVIRKFFPEMR